MRYVYQPIVDCDLPECVYTTEKKALAVAKKMFRKAKKEYLRCYDTFQDAVDDKCVYVLKYGIK
jgi:hypothetical protein